MSLSLTLSSMRAIFILTFSSFFLAIHCRKNHQPPPDNPYGLPNATQTGANTFACRVNGVNWVLKKQYELRTSFRRTNSRDTLSFSATGIPDSIFDLINFSVNSKIQQGASYHLNDTTKATATALRFQASCGPTTGYGGSQWCRAVDGSITISRYSGTYSIPACCSVGDYDKNAIIAGTFNLVFAIPGCDSIKVTDGRFDINYSTY